MKYGRLEETASARFRNNPCQTHVPTYLPARAGVPELPMSASGTLFLQKSVSLKRSRIFRPCQETRDPLAHGRRRESPESGPSKTLSAMVAGAWPSNNKLATGFHGDRMQVRSCAAGNSFPTRRAVRNTLTHAKPCQPIPRTPAIREIANAAAHAEDRDAVTITTIPNADPMDVSPAEADAMEENAPKAARNPANPSAVPCPIPSSSRGGRNC